jgi:hypothetical protein
MAVKPLMTWDAKTKTWFKKYKRQRLAVSCRQLEAESTKEGSAALANDWIRRKKQEIDDKLTTPQHASEIVDQYQYAMERAALYASWADFEGDQDEAKKHRQHVAWLQRQLKSKTPKFPLTLYEQDARADDFGELIDYDHFGYDAPPAKREGDWNLWEERKKTLELHNAAFTSRRPAESLTDTVAASYLKRKKIFVENGELSHGRYERMRISLDFFRRWFGNRTIHAVTAATLLDFHTHLIEQVGAGAYARQTAKQFMDDVKQFIRHVGDLYDDYRVPRNLDSRGLSVKVEQQEVATFTPEEIKAILASCPTERTRLFVLLALNTGMTQWGISTIYRFQLDYKTGYLTRKRGKTKWHPTVPTVKYKLWKPTLRLLKQFDSGGDVALLNEAGKSLVRYEFRDDGKSLRLDNIGMKFTEVAKKLTNGKRFKHLRKTGATLLASNPRYFFCAWQYLGHSARTIAERHYIAPDQSLFDESIRWLGEQLGIE